MASIVRSLCRGFQADKIGRKSLSVGSNEDKNIIKCLIIISACSDIAVALTVSLVRPIYRNRLSKRGLVISIDGRVILQKSSIGSECEYAGSNSARISSISSKTLIKVWHSLHIRDK